MKHKPGIEEVVERHRKWWTREKTDRPLVFVDFEDIGVRTYGHQSDWWEDPDGFVRHFESVFERRAGIRDDRIPLLRPPFSHGALPGIMGGRVANMSGSLWAGNVTESAREILKLSWDPESPFARKFAAYYKRLHELGNGKFAVASYELPGPTFFTGSLQQIENFILQCVDDPELLKEVCRSACDLAVRFYRWANALACEGQETFGGEFLSMTWAPKNSLYWSDHTAINFSPDLVESILIPAVEHIHASFDRSFFYCYPAEGPHVFPPIWRACGKVQGVHNCQGEMPGQSGAAMKGFGADAERAEWEMLDGFYREFAGEKSFVVKCPPDRIAHYREIFGDRGLAVWTFAPTVEEANRLVDSL